MNDIHWGQGSTPRRLIVFKSIINFKLHREPFGEFTAWGSNMAQSLTDVLTASSWSVTVCLGVFFNILKNKTESNVSPQVRSSSAGRPPWSSSSLTFSVPTATCSCSKSFSYFLPSSTQPWIPSSTPTVTKRWAPPSGRFCVASGRRTSTGQRRRDPTGRRRPSTTRCWAVACTNTTTTNTR